jgi:hypothetical protein
MLPGFRFLFAAILLSTSILVFGLGAAALLRAAHEEFASTPSWRAAPEPRFAQQNETPAAVLAVLRVEPAPAEQNASIDPPAPAEPPAIVSGPTGPDTIAALKPQDSSPPEAAEPEIQASDTSARGEAAPADAAAPADEARIAAAERVVAPANEAAASGQARIPTPPDGGIASTNVAALGEPSAAAAAQPAATAASAEPDQSVVKKRIQARRAAQRRRAAMRARLAARQAAQQPVDLFSLPTTTARRR